MKEKQDIDEKPPFFKSWKGLYLFVLAFEVLLIIIFQLITKKFGG